MPTRAAPPAVDRLRALVLDDSRVDRRRIERLFREAEIAAEIDEAATLPEFAAALDTGPYDLVLIDYRLGEGDGLIALEALGRDGRQGQAVAIMVAGEGQIQVAVDAMKAGCGDFLLKDHLTADVLARAVGAAMDRRGGRGADTLAPGRTGPGVAEFARDHTGDMRAILAGMLRHVRSLRRAGGPEPALQGVEAATARLWNFLETLKAASRADGTPVRPRRLN